MVERSLIVLEQTGLKKPFSNRIPHMRGTTNVLRLLFGVHLGGEHTDQFLQFVNGDKFHLLDAFSPVNNVLCSAVSADEGRRGKSTPIIPRNCWGHFKKAIEILKSTVVIVLGKSYWASIQNAFTNLNKITDTLYTTVIKQH